jgi:fumarate reductase flavoprotein subunit
MTSESTSKIEDLKSETVIIGGGGAGLAAAVSLKEKGITNVIVLEKRLNVGGNSSRAHGMFAAESPVQKQAYVEASRDALFKTAMKFHHYRVNPRIIRAYIDKSGDTIRWLEGKGIEFDNVYFHRISPVEIPVRHDPKGWLPSVIKVFVQDCEDAGIKIMLRTSGKRILRDEAGKINGVVAEKGEEFKIETKSVIITTGGFAGNKELLKKYFPSYEDIFHISGLPLMGDGLQMAEEAGAALEDFATMVKEGPVNFDSRFLLEIGNEPNTIWVNKKGERYIDESATFNFFECGNAVIRQPDKISYSIFDDKIRQKIEETGLIKGRANISHRRTLPDFKKQLYEEAALYPDSLKIDDSWDGIAKWIGANPDVLKDNIAEYNSCCDSGYDKIFAKEKKFLLPLHVPPYYAVRGTPCLTDTIGAIKINENMEVLDKSYNSIPGLYAAGVVTSGWESEEYCCDLSGSAIGFAINSGRIAGENVAKFLLKHSSGKKKITQKIAQNFK